MTFVSRQIENTLTTVQNLIKVPQASQQAESATPALLPQGVILRLPITRLVFPDVNNLKETGVNTLATGNPIFSRQVIYNNSGDDNIRVTYAVDVYVDAASAHVGYQEAVDASLIADGFTPLPDPKIGAESFAGTSGGEVQKHIGVGVRVGNIVIGVTRAGYDLDQKTIDRIVFLTRLQAFKAYVTVPIYSWLGFLRT